MLFDSLPHYVDVFRVSYTQDSSGADVQSVAGTAYAEDEPAWVQPLSSREQTIFQSRNQEITHKIYLASDPGLKLSDVLVAKNGDNIDCPYNGIRFKFIAFAEATAGIGILWKALVKVNQESQA